MKTLYSPSQGVSWVAIDWPVPSFISQDWPEDVIEVVDRPVEDGKYFRESFNEDTGVFAWEEYIPEPEPEIPPNIISDRQFFQQAAIDGLITEEEALEAVGPGTIPATMQGLINALPSELQFDAKMKVRGATTFERTSQTVDLIRQLFNWTEEQRDQFWLKAGKLL